MPAYFYVVNAVMLDGSEVHVGSDPNYIVAVKMGALFIGRTKCAAGFKLKKSYY